MGRAYLRELEARGAPEVDAVHVSCDRLPGQLHYQVELERIEVCFVGGADAPRERNKRRVLEEGSYVRVIGQVEHIAPKRLHPADQRAVRLAQPLHPARHDEMPANVNPAGEHA